MYNFTGFSEVKSDLNVLMTLEHQRKKRLKSFNSVYFFFASTPFGCPNPDLILWGQVFKHESLDPHCSSC